MKGEKEGIRIFQVRSEWKDIPDEAAGGVKEWRSESAVLEDMEAWLEPRVDEGELREKAMLTVYPPQIMFKAP